jgi:hypothetical protein
MIKTVPAWGLPGVVLGTAVLVMGIGALGGCSGGDPATPAVTVGAPGPIAGITPGPTEVPGPPVALLDDGAAGSVQGELGTFLWDGLGSDSPWIVPRAVTPVEPGAPLAVTLDPGLAFLGWTARWAPVAAGSAGDPAAAATGPGAPIEMAAPMPPGAWGLQVEITFAEGRRAAWYWSVSVGP